jgi:hypothetical protein
MNSLIASSLLFYPKPKVSMNNVKNITKNMFNHIIKNQYKTYVNGPP